MEDLGKLAIIFMPISNIHSQKKEVTPKALKDMKLQTKNLV